MTNSSNRGFQKDKEIGKWGEHLFATYLSQHNYTYEDVSEDKNYQKKDIDFIVDKIKYEVKTDCWFTKTGNLAIEDTIYHHDGRITDGWYHYTEADYLVYAIPPSTSAHPSLVGSLIFLPLGELRKVISQYHIPQKPCKSANKDTYNYLLHLEDYPGLYSIKQLWKF